MGREQVARVLQRLLGTEELLRIWKLRSEFGNTSAVLLGSGC
jgi:hypothetical protein